MAKKLHLDIETFSGVDISKSGVYKYCSAVDFEILMIAYAYDDEDVKIIDLMRGDKLPKSFLQALYNPNIEKHAHNANFERNAFKSIGHDIPIDQWHCTAIKSAYCGLPLSLSMISEALNLGEKSKLSIGKSLIKYFCVPFTPSESNGYRCRNLPEDDKKKWEDFKRYCVNDVIAEREIQKRLEKYEIPPFERENYILDQIINDRGILSDVEMAKKATDIDKIQSSNLLLKLKDLTGLENPKSPLQLKKWLSFYLGKDIKTLAKESIVDLIESTESKKIKEVLKLREKTSKSSTKKYASIINCANYDNRIRGLFQFYGASRTGRWAGRLVQLQNLPRNSIKNLEESREIISSKNYQEIKNTFKNIPYILSQLVRTSFIAGEGKTLSVVDFNAIEARVITWLADEKWRLKVFNSHGKIYEASASMMFKVPIEQITKGSDLREKGKIAELALGYQGALGALKKMGGEYMGLSESEMLNIVKLWRINNPRIVHLWRKVNEAVIMAIETKKNISLREFKNLNFNFDGTSLKILLPSGRSLFYREPQIFINRLEQKAVRYKGLNQVSKKWDYIESYGGKFVENIVQAISRDLLAYSMKELHSRKYNIVMHVHDEVVCEVLKTNEKESLMDMCKIMEKEVSWAKNLPLKVEGYTTKFYKKD